MCFLNHYGYTFTLLLLLLLLLLFADLDLTCSKIMRLFHGEFPSSEVMELAIYLDVPHTHIQEFRHHNVGDAQGMLLDVLNYWLETDPEKSWSKLAEAVEDCGYGVLAEKIRQKSLQ